MTESSEYVLGVDLGTTSTAAAVLRDGQVRIVDLSSLDSTMPSVLWLDPDGRFLYGNAAEGRAIADPTGLAREFKRRFGDPIPLLLRGSPFSADDLSLRLLSKTVELVTEFEGKPPSEIVLCHPAGWGPFKISLMTDALVNSTLPPTRLIPEPLAAAIHYTSGENLDVGAVVAIYDLGGGTFDVAFLRKTDDDWDLIGTPGGLERLGGVDFDTAVFDFVMASLRIDPLSLDLDDVDLATAGAQLRRDCVEAKKTLSSNTSADIAVFMPGHSDQIRITRSEFEDLIRPALQTSVEAFGEAMEAAQLEPGDVDRVLLVGGSSRIPLVAQAVGKATGRNVFVDVHPKFAVAMGAAASSLSTNTSGPPSSGLPDPSRDTKPAPGQPPTPPDSRRLDSLTIAKTPASAPVKPTVEQSSGPERPVFLLRVAALALVLVGIGAGWFLFLRSDDSATQTEATASPAQGQTETTGEANLGILPPEAAAIGIPNNAQGEYGDTLHNQNYEVLGPQSVPSRRWELGTSLFSEPIVVGDRLYGASIDEIMAIGVDDGRVRWSAAINANFATTALSDEALIVSQFDQEGVWLNLYDLIDGEVSRFDLHIADWDANLFPAGVLVEDGSIFLLVSVGRGLASETPAFLIRLDGTTGEEIWRHQREAFSSEPLLAIDGLIVSLTVGEVLAVSAETGIEEWHVTSGATELATLTGEPGTVLVQSSWFEDGGTFALDSSDGQLKWHAASINERAVVENGFVYLLTGLDNPSVESRSIMDGSVVWSSPLPESFLDFTGSLAAGRVTLYVVNDPSSLDGSARRVAALDKETGVLIWASELVDQNGLWITGALSVADGSLIIQDANGRISSWS